MTAREAIAEVGPEALLAALIDVAIERAEPCNCEDDPSCCEEAIQEVKDASGREHDADGKFGRGGGKKGKEDGAKFVATPWETPRGGEGPKPKLGPDMNMVEGEIAGFPITTTDRGLIGKVSKKTREMLEDALSDPDTVQAMKDAGITHLQLTTHKGPNKAHSWSMGHGPYGSLMFHSQTGNHLAGETIKERAEGGIARVIHHEAGHGLWGKASGEERKAFADALEKHPEVTSQIAKIVNVKPPRDAFDYDEKSRAANEVHAELNAMRRYDPKRYAEMPSDLRDAADAISGDLARTYGDDKPLQEEVGEPGFTGKSGNFYYQDGVRVPGPKNDASDKKSKLAKAADAAKAVGIGAKTAAERVGDYVWERMPEKAQKMCEHLYKAGKYLLHQAEGAIRGGKALALEVAQERGLPETHVARVGTVLAVADNVMAWTVNFPATLAMTGSLSIAKGSSFVPVASMAYVAYSGVANPFATIRAAKKAVRKLPAAAAKSLKGVHESLSMGGYGEMAALLFERLQAAGDNADWYEALVYAALDDTHDLAKAIEIADEAFAAADDDWEADLFEAKDASGHEHKGKGPGGGQFVKGSGGGGGGKGGKDKPEKGGSKAPSEKAERAKAAHVMVNKEIQRYAEEHNEPRFALAVGGVSFPDGEPVDIAVAGQDGKVSGGIELKTMVVNGNFKLTMDRYAQIRKLEWEKTQGAAFHTVVMDDHAVFNASGPGKHDESKRVYYYRRGVAGSARVAGMHKCESLEELKSLMAMDESQLPQAAQRTDGELRVGKWKFFADAEGKGYKNSKTGMVIRAKK